MRLNIIKIVVGCDNLEEFANIQERDRAMFEGREVNIIRTRYKPKRFEEILESGGSVYRVVKGLLSCRQKVIGFDSFVTDDGVTRCLILVDTEIIKTEIMPRKAFQGWRYFEEKDAPKDLGSYKKGEGEMHPIEAELREMGLL